MQEYASTSQTPPSRVLVTIPSHCFNFPPKLYMPEYASISKPPLSTTSCVRIQVIFETFPPKTLHARVCLNFTASPLQAFLSRVQFIFLTSPPKPYMQKYASTSQTPPSRVLVTIPSHCFNFPPKPLVARVYLNFKASPLHGFLC